MEYRKEILIGFSKNPILLLHLPRPMTKLFSPLLKLYQPLLFLEPPTFKRKFSMAGR